MEIAPLRQTNTVIRQRGDFLTEKEKERKNLLWQLFLDTGDPLCWMLCRKDREEPDKKGKGLQWPSR